ncbi:hypothetical protein DHOM_11580 [Dermabacter hominis 1368]|uniref:Colicin D immunity protein domain-containing protein n=1 Tax=Dermabacter hominis 1368 TaxID=1450519 RepID=A0ABR4SGN4_9MICO|nr:hypothetical protein DHOM_11580 [Dermabacter hominis 1368]
MQDENNRATFRKVRKFLMQILAEENPANFSDYVLSEDPLSYCGEANAVYQYAFDKAREEVEPAALERVICEASGDPLDPVAVNRAVQRIVEVLV